MQIKNGQWNWIDIFCNKTLHMVSGHMKRCSASLIIMEMQNKTTIRYHLTPVKMTFLKRQQISSICEDVEKKEFSCPFGNII